MIVMLFIYFRSLALSIFLMLSLSVFAAESQFSEERLKWATELIEAINTGDVDKVGARLQRGYPVHAAALELALRQPSPNLGVVRLLMTHDELMPASIAIVNGLLDWAEQLQSPEFLQLAYNRGLNEKRIVDGYLLDAWALVDTDKHPIAVEWLLSDGSPRPAVASFLRAALENNDLEIIKEFIVRKGSLEDVMKLVPHVFTAAARAKSGSAEEALEMLKFLAREGAKVRTLDGAQAVHSSVTNEFSELTRWLIEQGADVSFRDSKGDSVFHAMVKRPSLDETLITDLVYQRAVLDRSNDEGKTALHVALEEANIDLSTAYIKFGALPPSSMLSLLAKGPQDPLPEETFDKLVKLFEIALGQEPDDSAVSLVVTAGNIQVLDALTKACENLSKKVNVNVVDANGDTPLHVAVNNQRKDLVRRLLNLGANPKLEDFNGKVPNISSKELMTIALEDALVWLLDSYFSMHTLTDLERLVPNPLSVVVSGEKRAEGLRQAGAAVLLFRGADVNAPSPATGSSPLLSSVNHGYFEIARFLLSRGADPRHVTTSGENLLHALGYCKKVDESFLDDLLAQGLTFRDSDNAGNMPLYYAFNEKNLETAALFIERGADVAQIDAENRSLLHWVTQIPMDDELSEAETATYHSLFSLAMSHLDETVPGVVVIAANGNVPAMELYVKAKDASRKGVDINVQDKKGMTPLHHAAIGSHPEMAKWLLERGANPKAQDHAESTALHEAYRHLSLSISKDLIALDGSLTAIQDKDGNTARDYDCTVPGTVMNLLKILSHTWELAGDVEVSYYSAPLEGSTGDMFIAPLRQNLESFREQHVDLLNDSQYESLFKLLSHVVDVRNLETVLKEAPEAVLRIEAGGTVLALTGWSGHAINILFHKGYLLVCNRGDEANKPVEVYRIDESLLSTVIFRQFAWEDNESYLGKLPSLLKQLKATKDATCKALEALNPMREQQVTGNCGFESTETALFGILAIDALLQGDGERASNVAAIARSYETFQAFSQHLRLEVLESFLRSLLETPALYESASVHEKLQHLLTQPLAEVAVPDLDAGETNDQENLKSKFYCELKLDKSEDEVDACQKCRQGIPPSWRLTMEQRYNELKELYNSLQEAVHVKL